MGSSSVPSTASEKGKGRGKGDVPGSPGESQSGSSEGELDATVGHSSVQRFKSRNRSSSPEEESEEEEGEAFEGVGSGPNGAVEGLGLSRGVGELVGSVGSRVLRGRGVSRRVRGRWGRRGGLTLIPAALRALETTILCQTPRYPDETAARTTHP